MLDIYHAFLYKKCLKLKAINVQNMEICFLFYFSTAQQKRNVNQWVKAFLNANKVVILMLTGVT